MIQCCQARIINGETFSVLSLSGHSTYCTCNYSEYLIHLEVASPFKGEYFAAYNKIKVKYSAYLYEIMVTEHDIKVSLNVVRFRMAMLLFLRCKYGYVPLSHLGNIFLRIETAITTIKLVSAYLNEIMVIAHAIVSPDLVCFRVAKPCPVLVTSFCRIC